MAEEYDDEERAIIEKHRKAKAQQQQAADAELQVEIWDESGRGARLPYAKGRSWLAKTFGIDADDLKPQDEDEEAPEGEPKVRPAYFGGKRQSG